MNASSGRNSKFKLALYFYGFSFTQSRIEQACNAARQQRGDFLPALLDRHLVRWGLVYIHHWYRCLSVQLLDTEIVQSWRHTDDEGITG